MRRFQRGFTLIETLVAIGIFGLLLAVLTPIATRSAEDATNALGATHAKEVVDAASRYIRDNNAALIAAAGPSTPAVIDVATLQATGYLPPSFSAVSPFGESYQVRIIEPVTGQLHALLVGVGGDNLNDGQLRRIARLMGAEGGFISGSDSTQARGAGGGWQIATAPFAPPAGGGNIAAAIFFRDGEQTSDFLYRNAVPGRPELNRMNTNLNMGLNEITAASFVETENLNVFGDGAINTLEVNSNMTSYNGGRFASIAIGDQTSVGMPSVPYPYETIQLPGGMNFRFTIGGVEQGSVTNDGTVSARTRVLAPNVRATEAVTVDANGQLRIGNRFAPGTNIALQQANNGFATNQRELHVIAPDGSFADVGMGGAFATGYLVSQGYTQLGLPGSSVNVLASTMDIPTARPFAPLGFRVGFSTGAVANSFCWGFEGVMTILTNGGFGVCSTHPVLGGSRWVQPQPM